MSQLTAIDPKARTPRPLAILAILAVLAGAWFLLLRPIEQRSSDAVALKDEAIAALESSQLRLAGIESGETDELEPLIEVWEAAGALLPDSTSAREVAISMVERVSEAGSNVGSKVNIQPISDGSIPLESSPRVQAVDFSLTMDGSFAQFAEFLEQLEELRPVLTVSSTTVSVTRDGLTLRATFSVITTTATLSGSASSSTVPPTTDPGQ